MPYPNFKPEELAGFAAQAQQYQQGMLTAPVQQTPAYTNNVQALPAYTPPPVQQQQYSLPSGLLTQYQQSGANQNYVPPNLPSMEEMQAVAAQRQAELAAQAQAAEQMQQAYAEQQQQAAQQSSAGGLLYDTYDTVDPEHYTAQFSQGIGVNTRPDIGQTVDYLPNRPGISNTPTYHGQYYQEPEGGFESLQYGTIEEAAQKLQAAEQLPTQIVEDTEKWHNYYVDNPTLRAYLSVDEQTELAYLDQRTGLITEEEQKELVKEIRDAAGLPRKTGIDGKDSTYEYQYGIRNDNETDNPYADLLTNSDKIGAYARRHSINSGGYIEQGLQGAAEFLDSKAGSLLLGLGTFIPGLAAIGTALETGAPILNVVRDVIAGEVAGNAAENVLTTISDTAGFFDVGVDGGSPKIAESIETNIDAFKDIYSDTDAWYGMDRPGLEGVVSDVIDTVTGQPAADMTGALGDLVIETTTDEQGDAKWTYTNADGSTVAGDHNGNIWSTEEAGGGGSSSTEEAGGGGSSSAEEGSEDPAAPTKDWATYQPTDDEVLTPNTEYDDYSDDAEVGRHTNPDGSIVAWDVFGEIWYVENEPDPDADVTAPTTEEEDDLNIEDIFTSTVDNDTTTDTNNTDGNDGTGDTGDGDGDGGGGDGTGDGDGGDGNGTGDGTGGGGGGDGTDIDNTGGSGGGTGTGTGTGDGDGDGNGSGTGTGSGSGMLGGSPTNFTPFMTKLDWKRPDVVQNILLPRQNAFNEITMLTNRLMT